jgi:hypothetical protein
MIHDLDWSAAPAERDANYSRCWQRVSLALQIRMREAIPEIYFRDEARFEDRAVAYQVIAYAASNPFHGRSRTEFTYDLADSSTFTAAMRNIGRRMQMVLAPVERRLQNSRPALSRRYAPVWYLDILNAVKPKHRLVVALLAAEAKAIDAVIDLGTVHDVKRFEKNASMALRAVGGVDFRELIPMLIEETSKALKEQHRAMGGVENLLDGGLLEDDRAQAAGSPDGRVGGEKDSNDGRAGGRGEMSDAGIVADIEARRAKPAGQIV